MSQIKLAIDENDPDLAPILAFLVDQRRAGVNNKVDARDEMFAHGLNNCPLPSLAKFGYFRAGLQAHSALLQIYNWFFTEHKNAKYILDFASGYGRATRYLADEFSKSHLFASDILEGAMEFQTQHLGVNTISSTSSPRNFLPNRKFDFIWVASLFTHLPERTFGEWLEKLYSLLSPGGLLVFSTHPVDMLSTSNHMPDSGIYFERMTEIPTLDTAEYGSSIVTDQFVDAAINAATGGRNYVRLQKALNFTQDLYIVSNIRLPDRPLSFNHTPYGFLDHCIWINDSTLFLSGWALDYSQNEQIESVRVYIRGVLVGEALPTLPRPDIVDHSRQFVGVRASEFLKCGWSLEVDIPFSIRPFSDIILAKATSTSGQSFILRSAFLNTVLVMSQ